MKPPPFRYLRPATLDEAVDALASFQGDAKLLAGGQSLLPLLNLRIARPDALVDIARLEELDFVRRRDGWLLVGAATRQRTLERSPAVREAAPLLPQALRHVAHPAIRNLGTIGGSLVHADPAAELPAVALALEAVLHVRGPDGSRELPAAEFFLGPFTNALDPAEVLTAVGLPVLDGARTAFVEFARRSGDFAVCAVAAACLLEAGSAVVREARLAACGVGPAPLRLPAAEAALRGATLDTDTLRRAAEAAAAEVDPPADVQADAGYRRALLSSLVVRAMEEVRR